MLKNYFKTAIRNLAKNRFFTILNVFTLALGMSISLMFIALLSFIYSYDEFHTNMDRIYRVTTQIHDKEENPVYASAPVGLAEKLKEEFAGVDQVVRVQAIPLADALYGEKKISLDGCFTDPDFLKMFSFPLTQGDISSALTNPNSILLTETEAAKIFGTQAPLGETITIEPYGEFLVTGILKDIPKNSHIQFDALASYSTLISHHGRSVVEREEAWEDFRNSYVYILKPEQSEISGLQQFLDQVAKEKYAKADHVKSFHLQSLEAIIPGPILYNSIGATWDILNMILACSNYVHLAISQSLNRMKEIGVRKVMGGQKKQLFFQFVTETTLMMFLALILSYMMYETIRVEFLEMMAETDHIDLTPEWSTYVGFILFAVFLGIVTGVTPAIYFSKVSPVHALKGKLVKAGSRTGFTFRKLMITTQFILSLGFIMAVVIVMQQYRHSVNYDLGFERENLLNVELQNVDPQVFKNEFAKISSVEAISMSSDVLGIATPRKKYIKRSQDNADSVKVATISIDDTFIPNLKLQLLAGRNFSDHAPENARMIIVNEEFVKKLNFSGASTALGAAVTLTDGSQVQIMGVVKNFHYTDLFTPIQSFYFEYRPDQFEYVNLKVRSSDLTQDMARMEALWKTIGGVDKLKMHFFDDEIKEAYSFYLMLIKFWTFLGVLAITVSCLGLLGTVVFTIRNRVKEVSIRKVMGASSEGLIFLLSKDFLVLMAIATVITIPAIYFLFDYLLVSIQRYSIEIGFVEIFTSVLIMTVLCLSTILSQTLKAANANPAENLRIE